MIANTYIKVHYINCEHDKISKEQNCFKFFPTYNIILCVVPSQAITCMLGLKMDLERECARFLPKRK